MPLECMPSIHLFIFYAKIRRKMNIRKLQERMKMLNIRGIPMVGFYENLG